jgi:ribokinase
MKPGIVVIGGIETDYVVRGARLPHDGEGMQGERFVQSCGGKGADQAVAAARLGGRVTLIGNIGGDVRGIEALGQLAAEGVDTRHIGRVFDFSTGATLIMLGRDGNRQTIFSPGANRLLSKGQIDAAASVIANAKVVVAQLEVPTAPVMHALSLAKAAGARTVLDCASPALVSEEFLQLADVVRADATEAHELTGVHVRDRASAKHAAEVLIRRGARSVFIQAGDEGYMLVTLEGEHFYERVPIEMVDATGAGDAFTAAIAVTLAEGWPLEVGGGFANLCAALAASRLGAQAGLPSRDEVLALLSTQERVAVPH